MMTTPLWCLMALATLPYLLAGLGGYFRVKQFGKIDNDHPRIQCAQLTNTGARVWAAQLNAWEALAFFTATLVVAHYSNANPDGVASASLIFLGARIAHAVCYIYNLATLRSILQFVGLFACLYIFWLAINT